jgi:hypothetical protein
MLNKKLTVYWTWLLLFVVSNLFISIGSSVLTTKLQLNILQGVDFLFCCIVSLFFVLRYARLLNKSEIYTYSIIMCIFLVAYFIIGVAGNGFIGASIYLRMFLYPFILIFFGFWVGLSINISYIYKSLSIIGLFSAIFVLIEFTMPEVLYFLLNADDFYKVKLDEPRMTLDYLIETRQRRLFNFHLFNDVSVFKPAGPTFNYPSTSYLLIFGFFCSLFIQRHLAAFLILLAVAVMATKAGSLVLMFGLMSMFIALKISHSRRFIIYFAALVCAALSIWLMSLDNNIHMYSLLSSIANLKVNWAGQGLGFGGAMTVDRIVTWELDMLVGDSGVAIVLNMLGIAGVMLYIYIFWFIQKVMRISEELLDMPTFVFCSLGIIILVNSIIQELALGPYAIGLVLFILSVKLANKGIFNFEK